MDVPTYLEFEVHAASRLRTLLFWAVPKAAFTVPRLANSPLLPLPPQRSTCLMEQRLPTSHSTPKRLARLGALVPVKPIW